MISLPRSDSMREKLKKRIIDWSTSTTSHGLPRIITAKKLYMKLMWLFFLLVSVSLCAVMVIRSIQSYLLFDVTTTIRIKALKEIDLPVITICNMNSYVTSDGQTYMNSLNKDPLSYDISQYFYTQYQNVSIPPINDTVWLALMTNHPYFNETIKKWFSFWPEGFIRCEIRFDPQSCFRFLNWFYHPELGNCYKFNSGLNYWGDKTPVEYVGREGDGFAVHTFVNPSDTDVNYGYPDVANGIYVSIQHQQSNYLYPDFFTVKPGIDVRVKLSKVITETMPSPYGDCVRAETFDNLYTRELKKLGIDYNRKNCVSVCMQKLIIDEYGCYYLGFPRILNAEPCTNLISYSIIDLNECLNACPYECLSIKYDLTISTSEYPSKNFVDYLKREKRPYLEYFYPTKNITDDMIKTSFSKVFVYYDEIKETHITESESVPLVDFIANLGGTLGLFIGTSLLSFVEIIELIINLVDILIQNKFKRMQTQ